MSTQSSRSASASHYDRVTEAWRLVMGDAFHYGVFADEDGAPADRLHRATVRLNERMLAAAGELKRPPQVLDVGCGVGAPARWLATEVGAVVLGLSNSAAGVAVARTQTPRNLADRVRFTVADAADNGQPDETYDLVWVMESTHLMPRKAQVIAECARVLRPGGRLVLCDIIVVQPFALSEVFAHFKDFKCLERVFGVAKMETLETYRGYCEQAGLVFDDAHDISTATQPTLLAWKANCEADRPALVKLLGEAGVDDFQQACDILLRLWDEHRMGYGLISATKA